MENCTDNFSIVTAPRVQQRKIELMDIATSQESGAKGYKISSSNLCAVSRQAPFHCKLLTNSVEITEK